MLLFPLVSLLMLFVTFDICWEQGDISLGVAVYSAVLALANVAIIYLMSLMETATRKARENALLDQQMKIQTESIHALERSYRAQRTATHEYLHQMQTIHDLLEQGKVDAARDFVSQQSGIQTTHMLKVNSHHPVVDAVLNCKYQAAQENGIIMEMQLSDLSQLTVEEHKLVVLLSNLMDNAIEACCRVEGERRIFCRIIAEETLFLAVRNSSLPVDIRDGRIETSKKSSTEHGYGLPNICRILDSLGAEYSFDYSDGYFRFVAEIPTVQPPQDLTL